MDRWRLANKIEKMVLCGHSLGGYLSVCYAEKYPQRIDKLVLASPVSPSHVAATVIAVFHFSAPKTKEARFLEPAVTDEGSPFPTSSLLLYLTYEHVAEARMYCGHVCPVPGRQLVVLSTPSHDTYPTEGHKSFFIVSEEVEEASIIFRGPLGNDV